MVLGASVISEIVDLDTDILGLLFETRALSRIETLRIREVKIEEKISQIPTGYLFFRLEKK